VLGRKNRSSFERFRVGGVDVQAHAAVPASTAPCGAEGVRNVTHT
jgi:hypothetical protein